MVRKGRGEEDEPFADEQVLGIGRDAERAKRAGKRERNHKQGAARRRREGDEETPPQSVPDDIAPSVHDVPPPAPDAGASERPGVPNGIEVTDHAGADEPVAQRVEAEQTSDPQEATRFQVGQDVMVDVGGGIFKPWKVDSVDLRSGEIWVVDQRGSEKTVQAKRLYAWQVAQNIGDRFPYPTAGTSSPLPHPEAPADAPEGSEDVSERPPADTAEETDTEREKRENQEACQHFQVGQPVRVSDRAGFRDGWQVETVYPEHGVVRIAKGEKRRNVMAKLLLSWQPEGFTEPGAADTNAAAAPQDLTDAAEPTAPDEGAHGVAPEPGEPTALPEPPEPPEPPRPDEEPKPQREREAQQIELRTCIQELLDVLPNDWKSRMEAAALQSSLNTLEHYAAISRDMEIADEYTAWKDALTLANDFLAEGEGEKEDAARILGETAMGMLRANMVPESADDEHHVDADELITTILHVARYHDHEAATVLEGAVRDALQKAHAKALDDQDVEGDAYAILAEELPKEMLAWIEEAENTIPEADRANFAQAGTAFHARYEQGMTIAELLNHGTAYLQALDAYLAEHPANPAGEPSPVNAPTGHGGWIRNAWNRIRGKGGRKQTQPAPTQAASAPPHGPESPQGPERTEPRPEDVPLADARKAYAEALRSQVKLVLGRVRGPKLKQLRVNYEHALGKDLTAIVDALKTEFAGAGKDMQDAAVRQEFSDNLVAKVTAARLHEETTMRETMQEAAEKTLFAKYQTIMRRSAHKRLLISGVLFAAGLALPQSSEFLRKLRSPLTATGSGSMVESVWSLIETSKFATKKLTDDQIRNMSEQELLEAKVAHEWKHARLLTHGFGQRAQLRVPFFQKTRVDSTGEKISAKLQEKQNERLKTELQQTLEAAGGNPDQAILDLIKGYAGRSQELAAFQARSGKERGLQAGKTTASWGVGLTMGYITGMVDLAKDVGHAGKEVWSRLHQGADAVRGGASDVPDGPGEFLGRRPGITVDDSRANVGMPIDGQGAEHVPSTDLYTGQESDATIRAKEGIEHALRRQLEHYEVAKQFDYTGPDNHDALHAWSGGEAHRIALQNSITDPATGIEHPIIDAKTGTEQWVRTPGTEVTLHADRSVTVDHPSDLYTHAAYHPHEAIDHAPDPEHGGVAVDIDAPSAAPDLSIAPEHAAGTVDRHGGAVSGVSSDVGDDEIILGPDTHDAVQWRGTSTVDYATAVQDHVTPDVPAEAPTHAGGADSVTTHAQDHAAHVDAREAGIPSTPLEVVGEAQKAYGHVREEIAGLYKGSIDKGYGVTHAIDTIRVQDVVTERSIPRILAERHVAYPDKDQIDDLGRAYWQLLQRLPSYTYSPRETLGHVLKRISAAMGSQER